MYYQMLSIDDWSTNDVMEVPVIQEMTFKVL
jgi:hypothetical protein